MERFQRLARAASALNHPNICRLHEIGPQDSHPYVSGASVTDVSFSPDGQWLAYSTIPEGTLWRSRQ